MDTVTTTPSSASSHPLSSPSAADVAAGVASDRAARVKAAKRTIVQSGMRVGRLGMLVAVVGLALLVAGFVLHSGLSGAAIAVGLLAVVVGIVPVMIGWGTSKAGAPFLRALSEPDAVHALFLGTQPLAGGRRALALMLKDGQRQTIALNESDAFEVLDLVSRLSPDAETGERESAHKDIAKLVAA
jgi:hypothetical protein